MVGDSLDELHRFARSVGLKKEWFQEHHHLHYDITTPRKLRKILATNKVKMVKTKELLKLKHRWIKGKMLYRNGMDKNEKPNHSPIPPCLPPDSAILSLSRILSPKFLCHTHRKVEGKINIFPSKDGVEILGTKFSCLATDCPIRQASNIEGYLGGVPVV